MGSPLPRKYRSPVSTLFKAVPVIKMSVSQRKPKPSKSIAAFVDINFITEAGLSGVFSFPA